VAGLAGDAQVPPGAGGGKMIVYVVFVARWNLIGPTMCVTTDLQEAKRWAAELSWLNGGLETQVIRFLPGYHSSRKPISLFVNGTRHPG
jgi:hypothetical protein